MCPSIPIRDIIGWLIESSKNVWPLNNIFLQNKDNVWLFANYAKHRCHFKFIRIIIRGFRIVDLLFQWKEKINLHNYFLLFLKDQIIMVSGGHTWYSLNEHSLISF